MYVNVLSKKQQLSFSLSYGCTEVNAAKNSEKNICSCTLVYYQVILKWPFKHTFQVKPMTIKYLAIAIKGKLREMLLPYRMLR